MNKKQKKQLVKNRILKLTAVVVVLFLILLTLYYDNSITSKVIDVPFNPEVKVVQDIEDLETLNEGFYEIKSGHVFYLEDFNTRIPLWIKVDFIDGLVEIDRFGNVRFEKKFEDVLELLEVQNEITGLATGFESVTGRQTANTPEETNPGLALENVEIELSESQIRESTAYNLRHSRYRQPITTYFIEVEGFDRKQAAEASRDPQQLAIWQDRLGLEATGKSDFATASYFADEVGDKIVPEYSDDLINDDDPVETNFESRPRISQQGRVVEIDNEYYRRGPDKSYIIFDPETEKWKPLIFPFTATVDYANTGLQDYTEWATTAENARLQLADQGITARISERRATSKLVSTDKVTLRTVTIGGTEKYEVSDGDQTNLFNTREEAEADLRNKEETVAVKNAYVDYLKENNLQGGNEHLPGFVKLVSDNNVFTRDQLEKAFGSLVLQQAQGDQTQLNFPQEEKFRGQPTGNYIYEGKVISKEEANAVIAAKFKPEKLKELGASEQGLDEQSRIIVKDKDGNIKRLVPIITEGLVTGLRAESVTGTYTLATTVGDYQLREVYSTENPNVPTSYQVKEGSSIYTVDQDTLKQIANSEGRVNIVKKDGDNVFEFQDYTIRLTPSNQPGKIAKKTTEQFTTVYVDEKGNPISKEKYEKLKEEKEDVGEVNNVLKFKREVEYEEDGSIKTTTRYASRVREGVKIVEAVKTDASGKVLELQYSEDGKVVIMELNDKGEVVRYLDENGNPAPENDLKKTAETKHKQFKSRAFFANIEKIFTQFRGLGYYSTLFFSDDSLLKYREKVDQAFAKAYLGTEYWSSAICSGYIDTKGEGIAFAETATGQADIGAHVEATRSQTITTNNNTEYDYKITFNIRNGDRANDLRAPEVMHVNLIISGDKNVQIFKQDQAIGRGKTFGRTGRDAIVTTSNVFYDTICITFDKKPLRWKLDGKQLCNRIKETSSASIQIPRNDPTSSGRTSQNVELNDF